MLQFLLISALWAIDIGASGMAWEAAYGEGQVQGLLFIREANTQYHLGLGIVYIVFFIQLLWMLNIIFKNQGGTDATLA